MLKLGMLLTFAIYGVLFAETRPPADSALIHEDKTPFVHPPSGTRAMAPVPLACPYHCPECQEIPSTLANGRPRISGGHGGLDGKDPNIKISVPEFEKQPPPPLGMLVYLHGDGGHDFVDAWDEVQATAHLHRQIAVSIRAPWLDGDTRNGWWENADRKSEYLNAKLALIESKYNVDRGRTIFSGASGGSTFLAGHFIPQHGAPYEGGMVSLCGGFLNTLMSGTPGGPTPGEFPVAFVNGSNDFLLRYNGAGAEYSASIYHDLGYPVTRDIQEGKGHCEFKKALGQTLEDHVAAIFEKKGDPCSLPPGPAEQRLREELNRFHPARGGGESGSGEGGGGRRFDPPGFTPNSRAQFPIPRAGHRGSSKVPAPPAPLVLTPLASAQSEFSKGATPALLGRCVAGLKQATDELDALKRKMAERKERESREDDQARREKRRPLIDAQTAKRRAAEEATDQTTLERLKKTVADWDKLTKEVETQLTQKEAERKKKAETEAAAKKKKSGAESGAPPLIAPPKK